MDRAIAALQDDFLSPTQVAAQVVSGIGFLGAGVILREGLNIRGLNTAATLWCSAAIGVFCGAGALVLAAALAALILAANLGLRPLVRLIDRQPQAGAEVEHLYTIEVTCKASKEQHIRALLVQAIASEESLEGVDPLLLQLEGMEPGILRAVEARNALQKTLLFQALREHFGGQLKGRLVALWGLAFKPGTDDLREAPSLVLLEALLAAGARVQAHDPVANAAVAARYPQAVAEERLRLCASPYETVEGADALVLVTEWKQFRQPDFPRIRSLMRTPALFDGRNIYDPQQLFELGFVYRAIGRPGLGVSAAHAA